MDQFEAFFQRADLDRDGRINGAEAVAFLQGSNLPKQVLAQIWMHADQSRTGYLSRPEFYNVLKLVTVAQSKRELTADIVKAALYGPASAKIPAPQINLAAVSAPQLNPVTSASAPQMGAVSPTASQNLGFRGQIPPNASTNQQYYPSQVNQSMRPPLQMPTDTGTVSRPPHSVPVPDPRGNSMASPVLSNTSTSSDWLGGGTAGATSQIPNRGIGPSMPPVALKPEDPLSTSSLVAGKDPKTIGSGNGFAYNSMFGGDVFSANQSVPQQTPTLPTYTGSGAPTSSAIVHVSTTTQSLPNQAPASVYTSGIPRPSTGVQPQQTRPLPKPSQQTSAQTASSWSSSGMSVEVGNSTSNQSQLPWPKMTRAGVQKYMKVFIEVDTDRDGRITGEQARNLFLSWRLPREVLKQVWDLSDQDSDSMLSLSEFCIALYLMERYREGQELPPTLPNSVMIDETLLSLAGPPTSSFGSSVWGAASGFRPHQGMPGSQPNMPPGLRSQMQPPFPQADRSMKHNQQMRMPLAENGPVNNLIYGEQNSVDVKDEVEKEKKVEDKENELLDSKEKIEFYRTKMQDLVLYKSRCDNRLNEITERALADKREAELLGKKYEEKYKQVAEIASKMTLEEASFREIQERKMELQQALVNMEQGGSADGILQVRADRIQSDLEELLKALTERCKKHGINVKSTALVELPPGWEPGIAEVSAVWDEDWDKFEDEGFSFDVTIPATTKSVSRKKNSSPTGSISPDSSNADGKSEKTSTKGERAVERESEYTHSEDESIRSSIGSPARQTAFESPSKEYSDNHFRTSFEADTETHSFDEQAWGAFDNNDDIDSVWGFNSINAKDSDNEKHGERDLFESSSMGLSPIRTDSPQSGIHQRKSLFFEDSVPVTPLSRTGNSPPRYSIGSRDPFFDNKSSYDSFSMHDHEFSPRRETFTRFDSISSSRDFDHSHRYSFDDSDPFGSSGQFKVSESNTQKEF